MGRRRGATATATASRKAEVAGVTLRTRKNRMSTAADKPTEGEAALCRRGRANRPNHVRERRVELLLTQEQLARSAGVSLRCLLDVEHGYPCRMQTQRRLLRALGVSFDRRAEVFPLGVGWKRRRSPAIGWLG